MKENGNRALLWKAMGALALLLISGATWWAQNINEKVSITSDKVIVLQTKFSYIESSLDRIERKLGTAP